MFLYTAIKYSFFFWHRAIIAHYQVFDTELPMGHSKTRDTKTPLLYRLLLDPHEVAHWQGSVGGVRWGGRGGSRDRKSCKCWKVDTSLSAFTVMTNQIIIYFAYDIYFIMLRCKIDQIQICMAMSYFDIDTEASESSSALDTELSDCSVSTTELSDRSCILYWVAFGEKFQF